MNITYRHWRPALVDLDTDQDVQHKALGHDLGEVVPVAVQHIAQIVALGIAVPGAARDTVEALHADVVADSHSGSEYSHLPGDGLRQHVDEQAMLH